MTTRTSPVRFILVAADGRSTNWPIVHDDPMPLEEAIFARNVLAAEYPHRLMLQVWSEPELPDLPQLTHIDDDTSGWRIIYDHLTNEFAWRYAIAWERRCPWMSITGEPTT